MLNRRGFLLGSLTAVVALQTPRARAQNQPRWEDLTPEQKRVVTGNWERFKNLSPEQKDRLVKAEALFEKCRPNAAPVYAKISSAGKASVPKNTSVCAHDFVVGKVCHLRNERWFASASRCGGV